MKKIFKSIRETAKEVMNLLIFAYTGEVRLDNSKKPVTAKKRIDTITNKNK